MAVKHGTCLLTQKKRIKFPKPSAWRNFSASSTQSTRPKTGWGAKSTSLWVQRNFFWQLSRDRNLHGSGMSHATTVSPKPLFRAPWRVGNAMVGRGNAGWTTWKSGHPCPCQNCSQGPPAGKTGRGSLLNHPSCPPDDPTGQGTEPNPFLYTVKTIFLLLLCDFLHLIFFLLGVGGRREGRKLCRWLLSTRSNAYGPRHSTMSGCLTAAHKISPPLQFSYVPTQRGSTHTLMSSTHMLMMSA